MKGKPKNKTTLPMDIAAILYRYRRDLEKRFRGYLSEAILYTAYPLQNKRKPRDKFIVLCHPRTGSNMLVDMLNSHPLIQCDYELLINRLFYPGKYINYRSDLSKKEVYGFKLQSHHLELQKIGDASGFIQNLYDSGFKFIKLTRRNLYRAALSLIYARNSGKFHYTNASNDQIYPKISVNPEELLGRIQWMENQAKLIDEILNNIPYIQFVYEDALLDKSKQQDTANIVFEYLDVPHREVKTKFTKMNSDDISLFVENAEEIRNVIGLTPFDEEYTNK